VVPRILVASKDIDSALVFLDDLHLTEVVTSFAPTVATAVKAVRKNKYDVIILGDKLGQGDTYDVGLEIKQSNKNKHATVLCFVGNVSRATRLNNLLKPYSIMVGSGNVSGVAAALREKLAVKEG
jgi:DNA-binding response OmpR family regulator